MVIRNGSADPDTLLGSPDDDTLRGQGGADQLSGFAGNDLLQGGTGNDLLLAGTGLDTLYGGAQEDVLAFEDLSGGQAFGGSGQDLLRLTLAAGPAMFLDFRDGAASQSGTVPGTLTFAGVEHLALTSLADGDTVFGSGGDDVMMFGGRGSQAHGRGGADLIGYIPNDAATLDGGEGNDTLQVDAGNNVLYFIVDRFDGSVDDGQLSVLTGFETFYATGGAAADIAAFAAGDDAFVGLFGEDTCFGNFGNDALFGGRGTDSLIGGGGEDVLIGGGGEDVLIGGGQNDALYGGDGDDRLIGGRGSDVMDGGAGCDRILLYLGDDTVTGGDGADKFIFNRDQSGHHLLTDFTSGQDRLLFDPSLLQFGPGSGPLDPSLFAVGAASGSQAQFVLQYNAETGLSRLIWDPNGDNPSGGVYGFARFTGEVTLTAEDILIL